MLITAPITVVIILIFANPCVIAVGVIGGDEHEHRLAVEIPREHRWIGGGTGVIALLGQTMGFGMLRRHLLSTRDGTGGTSALGGIGIIPIP